MLLSVSILIAITSLLYISITRAPVDVTGRHQLLSAYSVVLILFSVYVAISGWLVVLNGGAYTWAPTFEADDGLAKALAVSSLAMVVFLISYWLPSLVRGSGMLRKGAAVRTASIKRMRGVQICWVLIAIGLALKLYLVSSTGGIDASALRLSGGVRVATGTDALASGQSAIRTVSGLADAGATWLLVESLRMRRRIWPPGLVLAAVLALSFFTIGKRLTLLLPILIVLVAYTRYRRSLKSSYAPVVIVGLLLFGMASLLFRVFLPAETAGVQIDLAQIPYAQGSIFGFYFYSLEYSTIEMITVTISDAGQMHSLLGSPVHAFYITNLQPFSYVVPRALWSGKPTVFTDVSYAISSILTGSPIDQTTVGYASTMVGAGWVFGGPLGIIILFVGLGVWARTVDAWAMVRDREWTAEQVVLFGILLNLTFHWFRQGTLGWVFIIGVVQQLGYLLGLVVIIGACKLSETPAASVQSTAESKLLSP